LERRLPTVALPFGSLGGLLIRSVMVAARIPYAAAFRGDTKKPLSYLRHSGVMKLLIAMAVALLILIFADANYNAGNYTRAVANIVVQVRHSFGV
jgi:hypothetical protein